MDICKWLNATEVETTLHKSENRAFTHARVSTQTVKSGQPEKERYGTPSKLEAVNKHQQQPSDRKRKERLASIASDGSFDSSDQSFQSRTSKSDGTADIFERRKRHKTRIGLYDPHSGRRGRRDKRSKKEKSLKKKKKLYHKTECPTKAPRSGHNLIQNFHANNVSRNRLTLQSSATLGLFKKGRASSPVRGRGLPDLAFSEMRFLQNSNQFKETSNHYEAAELERSGHTGKFRVRNEEKKISTFFTAERLPLAEKIHSNNSYRRTTDAAPKNMSEHGFYGFSCSMPPTVQPCIEMVALGTPVNPAIEPGTRREGTESTIYMPWSKSISRCSSPVKLNCDTTVIEVGRLRPPMLLTDSQCASAHASMTLRKMVPCADTKRTNEPSVLPDRLEVIMPESLSRTSGSCAATMPAATFVAPTTIQPQNNTPIERLRRSPSPISRLLQACGNALEAGSLSASRYISPTLVQPSTSHEVTRDRIDVQSIQQKRRSPDLLENVSNSISQTSSLPRIHDLQHRNYYQCPAASFVPATQSEYQPKDLPPDSFADQSRVYSRYNDRHAVSYSGEVPVIQYSANLQGSFHMSSYQNSIDRSFGNQPEIQEKERYRNAGYHQEGFEYDELQYPGQEVIVNDPENSNSLFRFDTRNLPDTRIQNRVYDDLAIDCHQVSPYTNLRSRSSEIVQITDSGCEHSRELVNQSCPFVASENGASQVIAHDVIRGPLEYYYANTIASMNASPDGRGGSRTADDGLVHTRSFWRANRLY